MIRLGAQCLRPLIHLLCRSVTNPIVFSRENLNSEEGEQKVLVVFGHSMVHVCLCVCGWVQPIADVYIYMILKLFVVLLLFVGVTVCHVYSNQTRQRERPVLWTPNIAHLSLSQ